MFICNPIQNINVLFGHVRIISHPHYQINGFRISDLNNHKFGSISFRVILVKSTIRFNKNVY